MKSALSVIISTILFAGCCNQHDTETVGSRTSALENSSWAVSEWISVVDAPVVSGPVMDGERAADGASWFLSTVRNSGKVVSAKWMTSGLGIYEIFVNGNLVGEEILKPGFTHYAKTKRSFTYDVTDAFNCKAGAGNVLSAQVTPGWWADKIVTPKRHIGMIGRKCAFRGVLELEYSDGRTELFGTDTVCWKAGIAGPVRHAAIFDGEEYDARELPGFATPEKLSTPEINTEFNGEILPSEGAEVYFRKDLTLKPVRAYVWQGVEGAGEGEYGKVIIQREYGADETMTVNPGETLVVDFGQNCAAVPSFTFNAAEGTVLTCRVAEILNDGNGAKSRNADGPEGSVHRDNLRMEDRGMKLIYTFGPGGRYVTFCPRCTFFGYRLVSITATDKVKIKSVQSIPVSSITEGMETGRITTGNEDINRIISNALWGQRSNYLSVPTDCPQRDERQGWAADTQVFAGTGTFFAYTGPFFHKWMRDVRDTQNEHGGFAGVAPFAQSGSEPTSMMRVGWSDAGIIVPWTIWKQFGDNTMVDECWDSMERFIDHVAETKYTHTSLIDENGDYQWADWHSFEPLEAHSGRAFGPPDSKGHLLRYPETIDFWNFLSASYWISDAVMMRDMAVATNRDVQKYEKMIAEAKDYVRTAFFHPDGTFKTGILNTMQTPLLFALRDGIFDGEAKETICRRLRDNFARHGNRLQTGFLGTSIMMEMLTDNGMSDLAYELLFQRENPSWLYSVDNGATTFWERWDSYTYEKGIAPRGVNSYNHYAYGAVCQWIWESVAGIKADPENPGFRHIIMEPIPDRRIGSIDAEYNSAAGLIKSEWHYSGDRWIWNFSIPEGSTATIKVPGNCKTEEFGAGDHTISI